MQVAKKQKSLGDEYHVAAATEWLGSILVACFPDRFARVPDPPSETPAPSEPAPATAEVTP